MGCYCNGKYHYTNMISALATGQISYKDAMCEIMKRLCELENGEYSQVQADWTETETDNPAYIKNKPSVSDFQADWNNSDTNSYGFIKNKPTIPPAQVQADWTETNVSSKAFIKNKPAIPSAQVQSDWNETDETEPSFIQNKPTIPAAQVQSDWDETVSTNPAYIKNKPTIPAAQVQSDWDEANTASMSYIQNKPGVLSSHLENKPTLVPPPNGTSGWYYLRSTGLWGAVNSSHMLWDRIFGPQQASFSNIINQYQTYPTFGGSRGTNLFGMSTDPRNDDNDWSIIQHWPYVVGFEKVDNHYWKFHITAYIADYTCTIPYETMQFYNFGFRADLVFANSGLTWDVYKSAYNANRTYSSVKYFSPGRGTTINVADVGLNATYTNAGGYLGMSDATGSGSVANTLTMGRYFNNTGNDSMGFGLWQLQNFQQGSWFEAELWVWL